jgi:hypothetical protein
MLSARLRTEPRKAARTPGGEVVEASTEALRDYLRSHPASAERAAPLSDVLASEQNQIAGHSTLLARKPCARVSRSTSDGFHSVFFSGESANLPYVDSFGRLRHPDATAAHERQQCSTF